VVGSAGSVFHHFQAVFAGDGDDFVHLASEAGKVHRHDGAGFRGDGGTDGSRADIESGRVHIHHYRVCAQITHHFGRGGKGVAGDNHLVTRLDADGFQRQVQTGGGGVDGNGFHAFANEGGKVGLELLGLGAGGHPAGTQGIDHFIDFVFADIRQGKGQEFLFAHFRHLQ
jgi:hypothetical protein